MTNFKRQIVSAAAAGALFLNLATPALAATEIVISGNGAGSDNDAIVSQNSTTTVTQSNTANVTNNVDADADTGDNDANFNTGGGVSITTGNATTDIDIANTLNSNSAEVDCCDAGDTNVEISGNGAYSDNTVGLRHNNTTVLTQDNDAYVRNKIDSDADTGDNDAHSNTGGDVRIETGDATVGVSVKTTANVNSARIGGGLGSSNPSATFRILGNGAFSDNDITALLANTTVLSQENDANVRNDVDADADTGYNDASFNTGGEVEIVTGDATVDVDVDNAVNFNHADVDCGCIFDVLAKVAGNGAESYNLIGLTLATTQVFGQDNDSRLNNDLDSLDADTGDNDVNKNTGEAGSDPSVETGDATSLVDVENSGNVNTIGDFGLPELPEVEFSFNFAALLAFFGLSM